MCPSWSWPSLSGRAMLGVAGDARKRHDLIDGERNRGASWQVAVTLTGSVLVILRETASKCQASQRAEKYSTGLDRSVRGSIENRTKQRTEEGEKVISSMITKIVTEYKEWKQYHLK